uniref:KASH domain-containing protein n=1 Tax=Biomphalaria glabrata TaxID=6526 RepID=A0A2C9M061_BIOGL
MEPLKSCKRIGIQKSTSVLKLAERVLQLRERITQVEEESDSVCCKLSQPDRNLVEERIRDRENSLNKLELNIQHRLQGYTSIESDLMVIKEEAKIYMGWLEEQEGRLRSNDQLTRHTIEELQEKVNSFKALEEELNQKQVTLHEVHQKVHDIVANLPVQEKEVLEKLMATVQSQHNEVYSSLSHKFQQLEDMTSCSLEFNQKMDRETKILQEREKEFQGLSSTYVFNSLDTEKMLEKYKSLNVKVKVQFKSISELEKKTEYMMDNMTEQGRADIRRDIAELSEQHEEFSKRLTQKQNDLQEYLMCLKKFEGQTLKLELWCNETVKQLEESVLETLPTEMVEERLSAIKGLSKKISSYETLLQEMIVFQENYLPLLSETDQLKLQEHLDLIKSKFDRWTMETLFRIVCDQVQCQAKKYEDYIVEQNTFENTVSVCDEFLLSVQTEVKQINLSLGPNIEDVQLVLHKYEKIKESLHDFEPKLTELDSMKEKLDGSQPIAAVLLRITETYKFLLHKVGHHVEMCKSAVESRDKFELQLSQQDSTLAECEMLLAHSETKNVSKYQSVQLVQEKLEAIELELIKSMERAKLIEQEDTDNPVTILSDRVEIMNQRCKMLREEIQSYQQLVASAEVEREKFETLVEDVVIWFDEKEEWIASCSSVPLAEAETSAIIDKHKLISLEVSAKLKEVKSLASTLVEQCGQIGLPLSAQVTAKLMQINHLEELTMAAILTKETYLEEAHSKRKQFESCSKDVSDWLTQASDLLDSGYDGLDYDTLDETITQLTDFFTFDSFSQEMLTQIDEVSANLFPTLDTNDSMTLKQTLKNFKQKYSKIVSAAQNKMAVMNSKSEQWRQLQKNCSDLSSKLDALKDDWSEINKCSDASPEFVQSHLEKVKTFLEDVELNRPVIDNVNETVRDLERVANSKTRDALSHLVESLNTRWTDLVGDVEVRTSTLQTNVD